MKKLVPIVLLIFLYSCAKDKLFGDKAVLIGTWKWTHTDHIYDICVGSTSSEILTPETEGKSFTMEFFEKGIVKYFENDKLIGSDRLVFARYGKSCNGTLSHYEEFIIFLDNNNEDLSAYFSGCVCDTAIVVLRGFPFEIYEDGCEFYSSFFTKQ
jgi:hypothetical protein